MYMYICVYICLFIHHEKLVVKKKKNFSNLAILAMKLVQSNQLGELLLKIKKSNQINWVSQLS